MPPVHSRTPSFSLAGAGSVLIGTTGAAIVVGILIGLMAGSLAWGFLVGALVGIPLGIALTIRRYRDAI